MLGERDEEKRLTMAAQVSMETQQVTPLIKEELRLSIIKKRHASGQDEIKVEFEEPKTYELTTREKLKRERRREQNRRAAQKCRQKKKLMQSGKNEAISSILNQNKLLLAEVKELREERKKYGKYVKEHLQSGCCRQVKVENEALPLANVEPPTVLQENPTFQNYSFQSIESTCSQTNLPSFCETFLPEPSSLNLASTIFQFPSDMRSEALSARTWSGASEDFDPESALPEITFDAIDSPDALYDDVFYDNDQLPTTDGSILADPVEPVPDVDNIWLYNELPFLAALTEGHNCSDPSLFNEP